MPANRVCEEWSFQAYRQNHAIGLEDQLNEPVYAVASHGRKSSTAYRKQNPSPLPTVSKKRESRLGLPEFKWTMTMLGLCIYSFAIITFKFPVAQVGIAVGVAGLFSGKDSVRTPTAFWLYFSFLLWAFLTSFISPFSDVAIGVATERFKLIIILLIALNALRTEGQLRFYLVFILVCYILFPVRGTIVGGNSISGGRVVWNFVYSNPNDLAALSLLALGVALGLTFSETSWTYVRIGAVIAALLLLVVILRTQSRGAFLGVLVALGPAFVPILLKQIKVAIGAVVVVSLVVTFAIPQSTWDRLSGLQKLTSTDAVESMHTAEGVSESDSSSAERFEILKVGWQIFMDNPACGIGLGAYPLANNMYSPVLGKRDTHNTYVNLGAETGLPGLLIWCSFVGSVLTAAYRRPKRSVEMTQLTTQTYWIRRTIIGYLVAGIFGSFSALNFIYIMLSVLWCSEALLSAAPLNSINRSGLRRA